MTLHKTADFIGRTKVDLKDFDYKLITIDPDNYTQITNLKFNNTPKFPKDSLVFLRVSSFRTSWFDVDVGTISQLQDPPASEFKIFANKRFNGYFRIIDPRDHRVIGFTDNIALGVGTRDETQDGLFIIRRSSEIAPLLVDWDIENDCGVVIYVNEDAPHGTSTLEDRLLRLTLFPIIMRDCFKRILSYEDRPYNDWRKDWYIIATKIIGEEPPEPTEQDELIEYVNSLTKTIVRDKRLFENYAETT